MAAQASEFQTETLPNICMTLHFAGDMYYPVSTAKNPKLY